MDNALQALIREWTSRTGLSRRALARRGGWQTGSTINAIMNNDTHVPQDDTLRRLAKALGESERTVFEAAGQVRTRMHVIDMEDPAVRTVLGVVGELKELGEDGWAEYVAEQAREVLAQVKRAKGSQEPT